MSKGQAALRCAGCVLSACLLLAADLIAGICSAVAYALVALVDRLCDSGAGTVRRKLPWHAQRYATAPVYTASADAAAFGELDEQATLANSTFPIPPSELIQRARRVLASEFGTAAGAQPAALLAEDFQFVAPIVGPLSRDEFLRAFGGFKVKQGFPDLRDNCVFRVDPLEPNRVWFFSRATGTHSGCLNFARPIAATGKRVQSPPQAQSMLFDDSGRCYTLTVGYCMDKRVGNTEGLGGVFALLKAIGNPLPFPEAQRLYTPSLRFEAFERMGKAAEALGFDPATRQRLPPVECSKFK